MSKSRHGNLAGRTLASLLAAVVVVGWAPAGRAADAKGSSKGSAPKSSSPAAIEVTPESFQSLEKDGELVRTSAERDAEGVEESRKLDGAMAELLAEQLGGKTTLVERYLPVPVGGKGFESTAAGNIVARVPARGGGTQEVVLLGSTFATRDLSETLAELGRKTTAEHNYAAVRAGLEVALAHDAKTLETIVSGLPEPGKLGKKDPRKLLATIVTRWEKLGKVAISKVAGKKDCSTNCEKIVPASVLARGAEAGACWEKSPDGLWAVADWTLKGVSTCVKDQGETRGTAVAFAIAAAAEAAVRRHHDVCPDLSEQHLHYAQKNLWFPFPPNFGDDLNAPSSVLGMMVGDYEFRDEEAWTYNLSRERQEVDLHYEKSCLDYGDTPCSDTNHQGQLLCARGTKSCGYTAQIPPADSEIQVLAYDALFDVQNASAGVDVAPLFLHLGLPIVASFQVTQSFLDAASDGWVKSAERKK
jgi:hypothetical protein